MLSLAGAAHMAVVNPSHVCHKPRHNQRHKLCSTKREKVAEEKRVGGKSRGFMQTIPVLVVEDNPADVQLMRLALRESPVPAQLYAVPDVPSALTFLRGNERSTRSVRPAMIIADLNLPGQNGHDLLKALNETPNLAEIPVVIFTSSVREEDHTLSQTLHAVDYVQKPLDVDEYFACVQSMVATWGQGARLL